MTGVLWLVVVVALGSLVVLALTGVSFAARVLNMKPGELRLALLSGVFFFLVLCGYFFIRPVRDAMGVSRGMDELRWLFVVTSVVSLVVVLAFGGVVARANRRRFIPAWYLFVIVCLAGFAGLLIWDIQSGGGLIGVDGQTGLSRVTGYTFFVWLSVVNLFMTSVFWAFMVDIFDVDQGKRMFAFIGAGGTLGSIVGSWATNSISRATESAYLPVGLILSACLIFAAAIGVMLVLDRMTARRQTSSTPRTGPPAPPSSAGDPETARSASFGDGVRSVVASPYLLGIGAWVVFMAVSNTMIYFTQANIVLESADTFSQRVENFALFDLLAQSATLITQVLVTTHLIKRLGVGRTLAILPLVTLAGFAVLAVWPVFGVFAVFQAVHRATRHAVSRPSRESLFSVVTTREKYQAKPVVDVFLYRFGDVAGAGIDKGFAALGLGIAWVAMATVPLAGIWIALSVGMGAAQARRAGP